MIENTTTHVPNEEDVSGETQLYRHFDESGVLLYVGISIGTIARLAQHRQVSSWFNKIRRIEIEVFPTRDEALIAERTAIASEKPIYNITRPIGNSYHSLIALKSAIDMIEHTANFSPVYTMEETGNLLKIGKASAVKATDEGRLGFIEVPYRHKKRRYVTGWQIIDYLSHLEREARDKIQYLKKANLR